MRAGYGDTCSQREPSQAAVFFSLVGVSGRCRTLRVARGPYGHLPSRRSSGGAGTGVSREGPPADGIPSADVSGESQLRDGRVGGVRHRLPSPCGKLRLPGLGHHRLGPLQ